MNRSDCINETVDMGRAFETDKVKRIRGWSWYNQGKADKCILVGIDGAR